MSFCRAQAKQDSERARESRQARKKGTEGTTRALCYCRGGAPRQVRVAITVPAGEVEVGVEGSCTILYVYETLS